MCCVELNLAFLTSYFIRTLVPHPLVVYLPHLALLRCRQWQRLSCRRHRYRLSRRRRRRAIRRCYRRCHWTFFSIASLLFSPFILDTEQKKMRGWKLRIDDDCPCITRIEMVRRTSCCCSDICSRRRPCTLADIARSSIYIRVRRALTFLCITLCICKSFGSLDVQTAADAHLPGTHSRI